MRSHITHGHWRPPPQRTPKALTPPPTLAAVPCPRCWVLLSLPLRPRFAILFFSSASVPLQLLHHPSSYSPPVLSPSTNEENTRERERERGKEWQGLGRGEIICLFLCIYFVSISVDGVLLGVWSHLLYIFSLERVLRLLLGFGSGFSRIEIRWLFNLRGN